MQRVWKCPLYDAHASGMLITICEGCGQHLRPAPVRETVGAAGNQDDRGMMLNTPSAVQQADRQRACPTPSETLSDDAAKQDGLGDQSPPPARRWRGKSAANASLVGGEVPHRAPNRCRTVYTRQFLRNVCHCKYSDDTYRTALQHKQVVWRGKVADRAEKKSLGNASCYRA